MSKELLEVVNERKEKFKDISSLFKKGVELTETEQRLVEPRQGRYNTVNLGRGNENELLLDYVSDSSKRRAQTVSLATTIATKLLVACRILEDTTEFKASLQYSKDPSFLEIFNKKEGEFKVNYFIYENLIEAVNSIDTVINSDNLLHSISDIAVSLAWLEAYYSSGYLPQDTTVLLRHELEHEILVLEVEKLLQPINNSLLNYIIAHRDEEVLNDVNFNTVVEKEGIRANTGLVIGTTAIVIKTGASKFNPEKVVETELRDFNVINNLINETPLNNVYTDIVSNVIVYYPRFDVGIKLMKEPRVELWKD